MRSPLARWLTSTLPFVSLFWLAGPGGFETIKLFLLGVCLFGALLIIARDGLSICRPRLSWLIISWILYLGLRAATAPGPATAWLGTLTNPIGVIGWWIVAGLALIIINHPWSNEDLAGLRRSLIWFAWLLVLGTALQHWTSFGVDWTTFDDPTRGRVLFGTIGSPAQLGVVAALLFGLLLDRPPVPTLMALSALTILSGSSTGLAILLISLTIRVIPERLRSLTRWLIGLGLALLCLLAAYGAINVDRWPSLASRADIWQAGLSATGDYPLWGWGPNHFDLAYDNHFPADQVSARSATEERAHNLPLEVLVETGLVGLIWLGLILYLLGRRSQSAAFTWLIAALFNPLITPVLTMGLFTLMAEGRPTKRQLNQTVRYGALIISGLLVYLAAGLVRNTLLADQANQYSAQMEFAAAANVADDATRLWPAHPQLALIAVEARTNLALQTGIWVERDNIYRELAYSRRQAVGYLPARTRFHIVEAWINAVGPNELSQKISDDWSTWSAHP